MLFVAMSPDAPEDVEGCMARLPTLVAAGAWGLKMAAGLKSLFWLRDDRGDTDEYGPAEPPLKAAALAELEDALDAGAVACTPSVGKKLSVSVGASADTAASVSEEVGADVEAASVAGVTVGAEAYDLGLDGVDEAGAS
jgi:hypothetical protein